MTHCPAGFYLLKVNNRNTWTRCEICSKLTIKTTERRYRHLITGWVALHSIKMSREINLNLIKKNFLLIQVNYREKKIK